MWAKSRAPAIAPSPPEAKCFVSPVCVTRASKIRAFVITADETKVVISSCDRAFCLQPMIGANTSKSVRFALGNLTSTHGGAASVAETVTPEANRLSNSEKHCLTTARFLNQASSIDPARRARHLLRKSDNSVQKRIYFRHSSWNEKKIGRRTLPCPHLLHKCGYALEIRRNVRVLRSSYINYFEFLYQR